MQPTIFNKNLVHRVFCAWYCICQTELLSYSHFCLLISISYAKVSPIQDGWWKWLLSGSFMKIFSSGLGYFANRKTNHIDASNNIITLLSPFGNERLKLNLHPLLEVENRPYKWRYTCSNRQDEFKTFYLTWQLKWNRLNQNCEKTELGVKNWQKKQQESWNNWKLEFIHTPRDSNDWLVAGVLIRNQIQVLKMSRTSEQTEGHKNKASLNDQKQIKQENMTKSNRKLIDPNILLICQY